MKLWWSDLQVIVGDAYLDSESHNLLSDIFYLLIFEHRASSDIESLIFNTN